MLDKQQQTCRPFEFKHFGFNSLCAYVQNNSEHCEGGGYLPWTEFKACASSNNFQLIVVVIAIIFFLFLFLHLSVAADAFFCENIATIVDVHNISQNIAGITFMAFGNGAPDIFGSIVSVISVPKPRADLAISELLGGSIFVTSCVVATIALTTKQQFLLMRRPILRDICFYSAALVLLLLVANWEGKMPLWQPLAFLALYSIYAATVVSGNLLRQRLLKERKKSKISEKSFGKLHKVIANIMPKKIGPEEICAIGEKVLPPHSKESRSVEYEKSVEKEETKRIKEEIDQQKQRSLLQLPVILPRSTSVCVIDDNLPEEEFHALDCLEGGKFFGKEELDAEEENGLSRSTSPLPLDVSNSTCCYGSITSSTSSPSQIPKTDTGIVEYIVGNITPLSPSVDTSGTLSPCKSDVEILAREEEKEDHFYTKELKKFWQRICPLNFKKFKKAGLVGKLYRIAKIPSLLLLGLTIPRNGQWSKPLAILHAFLAPLILCYTFKLFSLQIFSSLIVADLIIFISLFFALIVASTTSFEKEPSTYKWISSHTGFILSIAWIYATAAEVLNVVLMLGNLFNIPYQILGLTAVAWCNSIGDLVADVSVARQGMPRMALSAAIGGPLFNLMVGFGSSFTIAKLQGKEVTIKTNPVSNVMFLFLGLSLFTTLIFLFTQKFNIKRIHGLTLFCLYLIFIVCVIFSQLSFLPSPF